MRTYIYTYGNLEFIPFRLYYVCVVNFKIKRGRYLRFYFQKVLVGG